MKNTAILFFAVVFSLTLSACGGNLKQDDENTQPNGITLNYDEAGDYGKLITLNAGTDAEYSYYGFFLPEGTYTVCNKNSTGGAQVTVYKDGTHIVDGFEEALSDGCPAPIVVMAGEQEDITLAEGQYFKLADGDHNLIFILNG